MSEDQLAPNDQALSTRDRILNAAEELFAEKGIDAVSLREITALAGVNIAAIHYHFGSKTAVLEELFTLRAGPIAEQRLALLKQVRRNRIGTPVLEDVLEAFLRPALEVSSGPGGRSFVLLRARLVFEHAEIRRSVLGKVFDEANREFLKVLTEALPDLPTNELYWRFHFMLGAMVYTMATPGRLESMTEGALDTTDTALALKKLIAFTAAGFRQPSQLDA